MSKGIMMAMTIGIIGCGVISNTYIREIKRPRKIRKSRKRVGFRRGPMEEFVVGL